MDKGIYRGKRKDNGEWIEGYYARARDYLTGSMVHVIFPTDLTLYPRSEFSSYYEIIPETLGRLLLHADYDAYFENKKIFQNDIVAVWHRKVRDKDSEPPETTALVVDEHSISEKGAGRWFTQDCTRIQVIGNAYDNPELLHPLEMNRFINGMHECPDDYTERHRRLSDEYGIHGAHACCYICNFPNDYICNQYNGGCARRDECNRIQLEEIRRLIDDSDTGDRKGE